MVFFENIDLFASLLCCDDFILHGYHCPFHLLDFIVLVPQFFLALLTNHADLGVE